MELHYRVTHLPKDKGCPERIRLRVTAPSVVLQYYRGAGNYPVADRVTLNQRLNAILQSDGEDHLCHKHGGCDGICRRTGLWTINRDYGELEKVHWFLVVSLVKIAWETHEEQEFTLDLEDYTHDF